MCDDNTKTYIFNKHVTVGGRPGGVKSCPKFRDLIYGRRFTQHLTKIALALPGVTLRCIYQIQKFFFYPNLRKNCDCSVKLKKLSIFTGTLKVDNPQSSLNEFVENSSSTLFPFKLWRKIMRAFMITLLYSPKNIIWKCKKGYRNVSDTLVKI